MEITLEQLLKSRDQRWDRERRLLQEFPGQTLVVLTVVMPGRVKRNAHTRVIARRCRGCRPGLPGSESGAPLHQRRTDGLRGLLDRACRGAQREAPDVRHRGFPSLGSAFDLDVIQSDATPLSRTDVGFVPRRCLLCDQEARWCMRNHTHTQEEILQRIDEMVREFNAEN